MKKFLFISLLVITGIYFSLAQKLEIRAGGGGGVASGGASNAVTHLNGTTNAQQVIEVSTNSPFAVSTNGAGAKATNTINIPLAGRNQIGQVHSNDFQAFQDKQPGSDSLTNFASGFSVISTVQALTNATKVVSNKIFLLPIEYNLGNITLEITNGVKILGSGRAATIIYGIPSGTYLISPRDNVYLGQLSIILTNGSPGIKIPFASASGVSSTNTVLQDCDVTGATDTVYPNTAQSQRFVNCRFSAAWDCSVVQGGVGEFDHCTWVGRPNYGFGDAATDLNGMRVNGGTARLYGGHMDIRDAGADTAGVLVQAGTVEILGTVIYLSTTNTSPSRTKTIRNDGGTVYMQDSFSPLPSSGQLSSAMGLVSIEASTGREIRGITSASGRYTNSTSDRFVSFNVSSAAGTNTLPDIGFQMLCTVVVSNQPANNNTYVISGRTLTWKTTASLSTEIQIGANQSDSAFNLFLAIAANSPNWWNLDNPVATNVTVLGKPDETLTQSQTGTWGVLTTVTNDYATTEGRLISVYDSRGSAGTRSIKVVPQRNALISGATSYLITNNYGAATFQAVSTNWVLIHDGNVIRFPIPGTNLETNSATASGIVKSGSGQANKVWGTDGSGNPDWITPSGVGTPGGTTTQIQYNNTSSFDGASGFIIPASEGETNANLSGILRNYRIQSTNGILDLGWLQVNGAQTNSGQAYFNGQVNANNGLVVIGTTTSDDITTSTISVTSQGSLAALRATNNILDLGWMEIRGNQTNIGTLTVGNGITSSNTVTVLGTNNGAIRLNGTNTGWAEHTTFASGPSNSFVWSLQGAPSVGQVLAIHSVTVQGGTNQIVVTNATAGTGGTPGGSTTQLQYNNTGIFDGASGIILPANTGETNLNISGLLNLWNLVDSNTASFYGFMSGNNYWFTNGANLKFTNGTVTLDGTGANGIDNLTVTNNANIRTNIATADVATNEIVLNQYYTNSARRAFVGISVQLTAAAAGTAKVSLRAEYTGTITNVISVSAGPLASLVTIEPLLMMLGPSCRYYITNETSGTGASVATVNGTSSLIGL